MKRIEDLARKRYWGTIGAYRQTWSSICVKKRFSNKGLVKLAEELQLEFDENNDYLCDIICRKVKTSRCSDFE